MFLEILASPTNVTLPERGSRPVRIGRWLNDGVSETVFIPHVGFRSRSGLRSAKETLVERGDRALKVTDLVSTGLGTEVAIEIRDPEREAECVAPRPESRPSTGGSLAALFGTLRLMGADGHEYAPAPAGGGFSMGQHRFGFFGRQLVFERLTPDARRVDLEVRGPLGDWDVPIELAPIADTDALPVHEPAANAERNGIVVRISGVATTPDETILGLQATAVAPNVSIRGFGTVFNRFRDAPLLLVGDDGERHQEIPSGTLPHQRFDESGGTLAAFPRVATDSEVTLVVAAMIVREPGPTITLDLPVEEPRVAMIGPYPVRISSARVGIEPHRPPAPTAERPAVVLGLAPGEWIGDRRALQPSRFLVDDVVRLHGWGRGTDPEFATYHVPFPEDTRPKTLTLADPIVQIPGPWEIRFRLS